MLLAYIAATLFCFISLTGYGFLVYTQIRDDIRKEKKRKLDLKRYKDPDPLDIF